MKNPIQIDRISFFENDSKVQLEVQIIDGNLRYPSELLISTSLLNRVINALNSFSDGILDRLSSNSIPNEGKFFDLDLRNDAIKPILDLPEIFGLNELRQIRA